MGTRNITRVIQNGKMVVSQYGQWDGYPTGQLKTIVDFVRNKEKLAHMTNNLGKVVPAENNILPDDVFCKIANAVEYAEYFAENGKKTYFTELPTERKIRVIQAAGFSETEAFLYIISTRNTAAKILDTLTCGYADRTNAIPLHIMRSAGGIWDIEGIYTVDLDQQKILCEWHGIKKEYSFKRLPSDETLEKYEKAGYDG